MKISNNNDLIINRGISKKPALPPLKAKKAPKPAPCKDRVDLTRKKAARLKQMLPAKTAKPAPKKKWTVLCYFAGDCHLEELAARDLLDLEKVGSGKDMNLIAQIDRGLNPSTSQYGGKPGAVRYYVTKSNNPDMISSPELEDLGQRNSVGTMVLKQFLAQGMKDYPADNYLLLFYGHGGGAMGMLTDEALSSDALMTLPDFHLALSQAEKEAEVDKDRVLLAFKSCMMSQAETAYELKDDAAMLLASQSEIDVLGENWKLDEMLGAKGIADKNLKQMANHIFDHNRERDINTLSLLDLKAVPELKKEISGFMEAVKQSPDDPAGIKSILEITSRPGYFVNVSLTQYAADLSSISRQIVKDPGIKDPAIKKAAKKLDNAIKKVVLKNTGKKAGQFEYNTNGLGISTAANQKAIKSSGYRSLAFDRDTDWSDFMTAFSEKTPLNTSGKTLIEPQWKKTAQTAQKTLDDFNPALKELNAARRDIALINEEKKPAANLRPEFWRQKDRVSRISFLKELSDLNRRAASPQREIMDAALEVLIPCR